MSRIPKYEFDQTEDGEWYWHLKAANGEILSHGEGYTREQDVHRGIAANRRAAATAVVVRAKKRRVKRAVASA